MGKKARCTMAMFLLILYIVISSYYVIKGISYKRPFNTFRAYRNVADDLMYDLNVKKAKNRNGVHRNKQMKTRLTSLLENISTDYIEGSAHSFFTEDDALVRESSGDAMEDFFTSFKMRGLGLKKSMDICKSLVSGIDKIRWRAMQKVKSKLRRSVPRIQSDKNLTRFFDECGKISTFISENIKQAPKNRYERPIAYSILLNRPGHQTLQLLQAIYSPSNVYCLHVHSGATKRYYSLIKKLTQCVDNIYLATERFRLSHATFERIEAHLSCHRILLNSTVPWRYLLSLTGSVFPLRNNTFIADYLEKRHYFNGISYGETNHQSFIKRTTFVHEMIKHKGGPEIFSRTKRKKSLPPENVTLFRGDSSFIATREFIEFASNSTVASNLLRWSKDAKNPEEFFWATLDRIPGTPGGTPYRAEADSPEGMPIDQEDILISQENDLLAKLWRAQHIKCGGIYSGNLCVFNYKDLRWLIGQDCLFAESFDLKFDPVVIGCLYKNLKRPLIQDFF